MKPPSKEALIVHLMTAEQWRPVIGYETRYEISSFGRCRGIGPKGNGLKKPYITKQGYHQFVFYDGYGKPPKNALAHCMVAEAFIGPRPPGMFVCHGDGNPAHNRLQNLRYDTPKGNTQDAIRHGRMARGSKQPNSKLTEAKVAELIAYRLRTGEKAALVAAKFGVSKTTVALLMNGGSWKHVPYDPALDVEIKKKLRCRQGEQGARSKLVMADIHFIRAEVADKRKSNPKICDELGARFGVAPNSIRAIIAGRTWKHVPIIPSQQLAAERGRA